MVSQLHTFLFADLVGFTRFTVKHGDDRAAELAVSFQERVCSLAASLGCHVIKTIGDAVMVRSDNSHAALELGRGILDLAEHERFPLVRVGIDTGPAVERNNDWFGSTVNTAARVTSAANAGELLMTERTRDACAGACELELRERGRHHLEGLSTQALYAQPRAS
jgi:class 3 adenylate cyclase